MLRLLTDENFSGMILRGLLRRQANLDVLRVQEAGLQGADDPTISNWAAENDRIVLTHDRATLPRHAYERLQAGEPMPGVFVVDDRAAVGRIIDDILLFVLCSEKGEWEGQVLYL